MPNLNKLAPRDQSRPMSVRFKDEDSNEVDYVRIEYYKNRISLAPMEAKISKEMEENLNPDQIEAARIASTLCHYLKSWDLEGPLYDYNDELLVPEGEVIPLDPMITMYLPTTITAEIMNQLTTEVFPTREKSSKGRRR